ncbi:hypothetical protein HMPREF9056_00350 [Actinomyces sp. oral taxon 170 str. F0386]|nr:hypothetical protein HMPREF9056_00350 [Actinomyces sp. oral taxon 170 str. F0386]
MGRDGYLPIVRDGVECIACQAHVPDVPKGPRHAVLYTAVA